ncbi:MAG: pyridoxamine 5'-phosphate oxidase family protein [Candidatus Aureabacteria bacterium]|nr:pyridoxamine 5'-phosphate oxidase family protein [Candidatus Auribacterota bacterium]
MKRLSPEHIRFLNRQPYVILSTIGEDGIPHSACKGIVRVRREGELYLLDLYRGATCRNLARDPRMSVTVVDEHSFRGYCMKGRGRAAAAADIPPGLIRSWERKLSGRITRRIIQSVRGEKGHPRHPEALLPQPKYLIVMDIAEIIDLAPGHIR